MRSWAMFAMSTAASRLPVCSRSIAASPALRLRTGWIAAHDAASAGLGIVYWWANDNEIHMRAFASPQDDPGALTPANGSGMACVWELEVIDFERRAWLEDVLKGGDVARRASKSGNDQKILMPANERRQRLAPVECEDRCIRGRVVVCG